MASGPLSTLQSLQLKMYVSVKSLLVTLEKEGVKKCGATDLFISCHNVHLSAARRDMW